MTDSASDGVHCVFPRYANLGARLSPNGTGLGLSIVHGFAKQSEGDLRGSSEVSKGTSVEVWLPLVSAQAAAAP